MGPLFCREKHLWAECDAGSGVWKKHDAETVAASGWGIPGDASSREGLRCWDTPVISCLIAQVGTHPHVTAVPGTAHLDFTPESLGKGSAELGHGALIPVIPVIPVLLGLPEGSHGEGVGAGAELQGCPGHSLSTGGLQKGVCGRAFCSLTPGTALPAMPGKSFPILSMCSVGCAEQTALLRSSEW